MASLTPHRVGPMNCATASVSHTYDATKSWGHCDPRHRRNRDHPEPPRRPDPRPGETHARLPRRPAGRLGPRHTATESALRASHTLVRGESISLDRLGLFLIGWRAERVQGLCDFTRARVSASRCRPFLQRPASKPCPDRRNASHSQSCSPSLVSSGMRRERCDHRTRAR